MKAEVLRVSAKGSCEARTENALLIVFSAPAEGELRPGDALEFSQLVLDGEVIVANLSHNYTFAARLVSNNIHDLRLPAGHGTSRTPSEARLRGP
jgi:hypothetical protein